ncbi:MAG: TolC family protein [Nitrospinales bacterium]
MKRWVSILVLLVFCAHTGLVWGQQTRKFKENLNRFITEALENNPELKEAREKIKAYKEIPSQAGSLDDPMLKFELKNLPTDSFSFSSQAMTQKQITLSQKFPFPGKLGLRTEIAEKNVKIVEESYEDLKLSLIKEVKVSFYELCFILASIEITKENKSLLKQFITIAETKYSVGKGIQQDVIKAQVELSKIMDELVRLDKRRDVEKARLNTLMNRMPQAPLSISHGITKTPFNYTLKNLQRTAEGSRPVLKGIRSVIERFKVSGRLAEKDFFPDFNVGFRYGQRQSNLRRGLDHPDFVSAFVGINIPLWQKSKQRRKVLEENRKVIMAQETYNKTRNEIFLKIKESLDEEVKGTKLLKLIKTGIIPQARQSLESALAGYGVDKVDFLTLLDNEITLFKWQIRYHKELTDYEKNLARLEHVVGKRLF